MSHSSKNNVEAIALREWLDANGWPKEDVFLDLDPLRGLVAGEQWQVKLREASHRCEAVMFVISPAWTQSRWCGAEFLLAKTLGKKIFGVIVEPTALEALPPELTSEFQLVDLTAGGDQTTFEVPAGPNDGTRRINFYTPGLRRLRLGLEKAGLNARSFAFDPERPIFRGLRALEEKDAAIFFGREAKIIEAIDSLRTLSDKGASKFLVILGASGAGKSSFLRAGLWPRLQRDDRAFLPLPVIRPSDAVITGERGLAWSLSEAAKVLAIDTTRAAIEASISRPDGLLSVLSTLQKAAQRRFVDDGGRPPSIVLLIDQGEELFEPDAGAEATKFFDTVSPLAKEGPLLIVLCMRSDSFERLQRALQGARNSVETTVFSLPPMPPGSYKEVIEGPVRRLHEAKGEGSVRLDPHLTEQLLTDIGGENADALPLLAFVLERLYRSYSALTLTDYDASGGLQGAIVAAVAEALKNPTHPPVIPASVEAQRALLRRTLIPHLARVDSETGKTRRQIARLANLADDAHALIDRLVEARLLTKHQPLGQNDGPGLGQSIQVELVHEALLRQWPDLKHWLKEEHTNLIQLEQVLQATADWARNSRKPEWLVHKGGRLADAEALGVSDQFKSAIDGNPRQYLKACHELEAAALAKEMRAVERDREQVAQIASANRRAVQRLRVGVGILAVSAVVLGLGAIQLWSLSRTVDEKDMRLALRDAMSISAPGGDSARGDALAGLQILLLGVPQDGDSLTAPSAKIVRDALRSALARLKTKQLHSFGNIVTSVVSIGDGNRVLVTSGSAVHELSLAGHETKQFGAGRRPQIWSADVDRKGSLVITGAEDGTAQLWNYQTGKDIAKFSGQPGSIRVAISEDGMRYATGAHDGSVLVWNNRLEVIWKFQHQGFDVRDLEFSPDGSSLAVATTDKVAHVYDLTSGHRNTTLTGHTDTLRAITFSNDGLRIATGSSDRSARIWSAATGQPIAQLYGHLDAVRSVAFSHDGHWAATGSWDKTARLWDAESGRMVTTFSGHEDPVRAVTFGPGDRVLVTGSNDRTVRVWDTSFAIPRVRLRGHSRSVTSIAANASIVATASDDGSVRVWDKTSGDVRAVIDLQGHEANAVAMTDNGEGVLVGSRDGLVTLWHWPSKQKVRVFPGHSDSVLAVDVASDGTRVMSGSKDGTVRIWETRTGKATFVFRGHRSSVTTVRFSPDSRIALSGSRDTRALLWDTTTGGQLQEFAGHTDTVRGVAFLGDQTRIATASGDSTAAIWEISTGKRLHVLTGHQGGVNAVDVSRDGDWLLTGSDDRTARIWDTVSGLMVATLGEQREGVNAVAFASDGRNDAAIGTGEGTVSLWTPELARLPLSPKALISEACRVLLRVGATSYDVDSSVREATNGRPLPCRQAWRTASAHSTR